MQEIFAWRKLLYNAIPFLPPPSPSNTIQNTVSKSLYKEKELSSSYSFAAAAAHYSRMSFFRTKARVKNEEKGWNNHHNDAGSRLKGRENEGERRRRRWWSGSRLLSWTWSVLPREHLAAFRYWEPKKKGLEGKKKKKKNLLQTLRENLPR
jgi:hypothetical protein